MKATLTQLANNKLCSSYFLHELAIINSANVLYQDADEMLVRIDLYAPRHNGTYFLIMPSIEVGDLGLNENLDHLIQHIQGELAELQGVEDEHDPFDELEEGADIELSKSLVLALHVETKRTNIYKKDGQLLPSADRLISCQFAAARAVAQVVRNFYPENEHVFNPLDNEPLMKTLYDYVRHNIK